MLDVGASRGQFASFALSRFPPARIVCFEPLSSARATLVPWAPRNRVTVHPIALGEERGELELHISARDDSSSLLPVGERQVEAFPGTMEVGRERVRVGVLEDYLGPGVRRPCS